MYQKAYGIIETLAPLHVGASAGEETGNLNLIFRDQFTQTGIIPGSSIRGRFRADMREVDRDWANDCYGHEAEKGNSESTTEAQIKFEYASLVWLPVFCPGQPVVWVSCPRLLRRYQQITKLPSTDINDLPKRYTVKLEKHRKVLFFNLGYLKDLKENQKLSDWVPKGLKSPPNNLVIVDDKDISIIHEMALYRQSRTKLEDHVKKVEYFFGVEALPEGSILVFPTAVKQKKDNNQEVQWKEALDTTEWEFDKPDTNDANLNQFVFKELYFGGLESIGFGRCHVTLSGKYFETEKKS
ncbi:RAMP superfamily CRISPR-associated protein [Nostoc sp. 'Peltigera membranacea cyanobiont' N6]|uniref:RAMP superfamily CRISPR-associated protein n=1 Tax=Nostoc sp. 'Peltigera membranacea cyanobiont' N6 TaxID=1261031 RepID=UPI000CF309C3|nr:RAMP superfamily CRISPR-associated protein [Nostoc sp. 'Peltigera membranacea cyanobiont' N6]AVH68230.1 CRISPR-associated protein Cmr4 [Nostoc sp. 'Peltigera membranacea cyanobiont' N6]